MVHLATFIWNFNCLEFQLFLPHIHGILINYKNKPLIGYILYLIYDYAKIIIVWSRIFLAKLNIPLDYIITDVSALYEPDTLAVPYSTATLCLVKLYSITYNQCLVI